MALNGKSAKLVRPTRKDLEKRADALAKRLGLSSRAAAFKKLKAGKLPSTIAATELAMVQYLLDAE